jgi:CheY-like chemotaxis protein
LLGHEVLVALRPRDALAILASPAAVDAVISDLHMPGMSGVDLAREIRWRYRSMPLAFWSGALPGDPIHDLAVIMGPILPKIHCSAELVSILDHLCALRSRMAA